MGRAVGGRADSSAPGSAHPARPMGLELSFLFRAGLLSLITQCYPQLDPHGSFRSIQSILASRHGRVQEFAQLTEPSILTFETPLRRQRRAHWHRPSTT